MGKLIRNGIEYGGGNGTDIFEVTQAEYDALVQAGTLVHNALYVITDAPNLNATAKQISYDGGTDTVWDKVEKCLKSDELIVFDSTYNSNANGTVDSNQMVSGGIPYASYYILSIWSEDGYLPVISKYSSRYTFEMHSNSDFSLVRSSTVKLRLIVAKNLTQ